MATRGSRDETVEGTPPDGRDGKDCPTLSMDELLTLLAKAGDAEAQPEAAGN